MLTTNYHKNVFLNCPFDKEYAALFNAITFTSYDCGYKPRCALEIQDSSENRLKKILQIINDCQFAIHDISRTDLDKKHKLPRFNMPFELGLFMGAKYYGSKQHKTKNCLILDSDAYRYQKFISDIAGHDIEAHENNIKQAIFLVRNWLNHFHITIEIAGIPGPTHIQKRYEKFQLELPILCKRSRLSLDNMVFKDYLGLVAKWLENQNFNYFC